MNVNSLGMIFSWMIDARFAMQFKATQIQGCSIFVKKRFIQFTLHFQSVLFLTIMQKFQG